MSLVTRLLRRYGAGAVMIALALASFWTIDRMELELLTGDDAERHTPDLYIENFVTTKMNEHGTVHRRVEAEYMAHFPDTDTHEFQHPYMVMYREEGPPWHVRSERGWLSASGDVMLLLGKVHIWRNNASGLKEIDVKTEDLRVLPEREYGETDQAVLITTITTQTRAVGMKAHLAESRLELLSKVHTRHEPAKN